MNAANSPGIHVHHDESVSLARLKTMIQNLEHTGRVDADFMDFWCKDQLRLRPVGDRIVLLEAAKLEQLNEEEKTQNPSSNPGIGRISPQTTGPSHPVTLTIEVPSSDSAQPLGHLSFWEAGNGKDRHTMMRETPAPVNARTWDAPKWFVCVQKVGMDWAMCLAQVWKPDERVDLARAHLRLFLVAGRRLSEANSQMKALSTFLRRINMLLAATGNERIGPECFTFLINQGDYQGSRGTIASSGSVVCDIFRRFALHPHRF